MHPVPRVAHLVMASFAVNRTMSRGFARGTVFGAPHAPRGRVTTDRTQRPRRVVAALGGNAFAPPGEGLTMAGQFRYAREALSQLGPLLDDRTELVLAHGNGPQVGHMLIRVEETLGHAYALPLSVCVAETEGELGYVLSQSLHNVLNALKLRRPIASLLTQVRVDVDDPAFANPTKPVGPFYTEAQADALKARGFAVREDAGRGWRRVVPSPEPRAIVDVAVIDTLLRAGALVVAIGGGGVPVFERDGALEGVDAVIDKDLASALLADRLDASVLVILTDVANAFLDWRKPTRRAIGKVTVSEARALLREGHFAEGSMGPKIEAAARFASRAGRRAIITNPSSLSAALEGAAGTEVISD